MKNSDMMRVIESSTLFSGVTIEQAAAMLKCLSAAAKDYSKNETILHSGDTVSSVGMVLTGAVSIIKDDFWGNRNILSKVTPGHIFAETYACIEGTKLSVSAIADEPATVLWLDIKRVLTACTSACEFHARLIRNLLSALAGKNLIMNEKLTHVTQRTTREKLLSYLSAESQRHGSASFTIPFNRQQLADYLSVERSAMSGELGRMRDDGLLEFDRNDFTLKV